MNDSPRRRARELVLLALYAQEHGEKSADEAFVSTVAEEKMNKKNLEFSRALFDYVLNNIEWADQQIVNLADNWKIERIAAIDRTILRMALVEIEHIPQTPIKVVLNEAIELAKKFSTMESSRFVNGILDNFVKKMENM